MAKKKDTEKKVTPMHFCIEEKDVEKQFDCESFCLYKAAGFMHYMAKGGYHVFVKPEYESLYGTLELLLDALIASDGKPASEKDNLLEVADFVSSILFAPTMMFFDEEIMFEAYGHIQDYIKRIYERAVKLLRGEDFDKNNDYEGFVRSAEELLGRLNVVADALPEDRE